MVERAKRVEKVLVLKFSTQHLLQQIPQKMARVLPPLGANIDNDKLEEMYKVAKQIASPGKGILASDEV